MRCIPEDHGHHEGHGRKDVAHGAREGRAGELQAGVVEVLVDHRPACSYQTRTRLMACLLDFRFRKADKLFRDALLLDSTVLNRLLWGKLKE